MGKGPLLDFGKQELYISALQELAAKLTIVDGGEKNEVSDSSEEIVVCSPQIRALMEAYQFYGSGVDGIVVVACSPQDSGKSLAAEYILHGDHEFRPQRALKLSAVGMDDFVKEFSEQYLGRPENGALTAEVLVNALKSTGQGIVRKAAGKTTPVLFAMDKQSFNEKDAIKLVSGKHTFVQNLPITFRHPPLLVIDDFDVDSTANENFVRKLYTLAASAKIIVFILTTNDEWATKLVKLYGGTKIVPLYGNIDNLWDVSTPFTARVPVLTGIPCSGKSRACRILSGRCVWNLG
jgi:hypothetical protein